MFHNCCYDCTETIRKDEIVCITASLTMTELLNSFQFYSSIIHILLCNIPLVCLEIRNSQWKMKFTSITTHPCTISASNSITKHKQSITSTLQFPKLCLRLQLKPRETRYHAHQINVLLWPLSKTLASLCLSPQRPFTWEQKGRSRACTTQTLYSACRVCIQVKWERDAWAVMQRSSFPWHLMHARRRKKKNEPYLHLSTCPRGNQCEESVAGNRRLKKLLQASQTVPTSVCLPQQDRVMLWWHHFCCHTAGWHDLKKREEGKLACE